MKLLSVQSETKALISVCKSTASISSMLMAALDENSFHYPPAKRAFAQIIRHMREDGELPSWDVLCATPELNESTRKTLRAIAVKPLQDPKHVRQLVRTLDKYRKLRSLLDTGRLIMDSLEDESVDVDSLLDKASAGLVTARIRRQTEQTLAHLGKGNNSAAIVKELLYGEAEPFIPTGFAAHDDRNSGFLRGSLVLIGADTGGGKCLVGSSLVPTSRGLLSLEELRRMSTGRTPQALSHVLESAETEGFVPFHIGIRGIHNHEHTDATYARTGACMRVTTELGDVVEGLPEHKLLAMHDGDLEPAFVRLKDLTTEHWVVKSVDDGVDTGAFVCMNDKPLDEETSRSLASRAAVFCLYGARVPMKTLKLLDSYWNSHGLVPAGERMQFNDHWIKLLRTHCGSNKRHVPYAIRVAGQRYQRVFVESFLHFARRTAEGRVIRSRNKSLLLQVKALMESLGMHCRLVPGHITELCVPDVENPLVPVVGLARYVARKMSRGNPHTKQVRVLDALTLIEQLAEFPELAKQREDLEYIMQYRWARVIDSRHTGVQPVYDLSVPGTRTYSVQGVMSHNTSMAANLLRNMAEQGEDTAFVSLEMSKAQSLARLLALITGIDLAKISQRKLTDKEKKQIKKAYAKWVTERKQNNTRFSIFAPDEDVTLEDVLMSLRPYGYDVILIDYVSLLKDGDEGEQQWRSLQRVTRVAKRYAEANGILVIMLVQVNAQGLVKYSSSMTENANNCWVWLAPKEESDVMTLDIAQLKARNQSRFNFQLSSQNSTGLITDVSAHAEAADAEEGDQSDTSKEEGFLRELNEDEDHDGGDDA